MPSTILMLAVPRTISTLWGKVLSSIVRRPSDSVSVPSAWELSGECPSRTLDRSNGTRSGRRVESHPAIRRPAEQGYESTTTPARLGRLRDRSHLVSAFDPQKDSVSKSTAREKSRQTCEIG